MQILLANPPAHYQLNSEGRFEERSVLQDTNVLSLSASTNLDNLSAIGSTQQKRVIVGAPTGLRNGSTALAFRAAGARTAQ